MRKKYKMKRYDALYDVIQYINYIIELGKLSNKIEMIKGGYIKEDLKETEDKMSKMSEELVAWMQEEV